VSNAVAWFLATFVTLPILAFYLIYIVCVKTTRNKKRSFKLAVDLSTILFIISVHFIVYEIWEVSLFGFILLLILIIAIIFTIIHWKIAEDIQLSKLLRGIWRFNFLLFFLIYFLLSIYGLFIRVISIQ
jgi:hypothetical protein